ncbi:MAG: alpha/beta hydrolase [Bacillota bacterium]
MNIQSGIAFTERDELYYKVRGTGKPIFFIAPGGGNGDDYLPVANILADSYEIITYDRRANARSTRNFPNEFNIRQQSRDALAVLNAVGEAKAMVVGNSSGAVIALDMATAFPEHVHAAIIHEAPVPSVLPEPEAGKWKDFFATCYKLAVEKGASAGAKRFFFGAELPAYALLWATIKLRVFMQKERLDDEPPRISREDATDVLLLNELLSVTWYEPDFEKAKTGGAKLFFGCSQYGLKRNAWYAVAAQIMAEKLTSEMIEFPGHHGSHMDRPVEWAKVIRAIAHKINW